MYNFVLENVLLQYYFTLYTFYIYASIWFLLRATLEYQLSFIYSEEVSRYMYIIYGTKQTSFCLHYLPHTRLLFHVVFPIHSQFCYVCTSQYYILLLSIFAIYGTQKQHTQTHKCLSHSRCSLQLSMTLKIVLFAVFYAFHIIQNKKEYYIRFIWELEFYGCRCCVI